MKRLHPRFDPGLHLVDEAGHVGCTRIGHDVGVEICLACPSMDWVEQRDGVVTAVRCRPPLATVGPEPWLGLVPRY